MIQNKEVLEQIREEAVKELNSYDCRILVCSGTGCVATGSQKIYGEIHGDCQRCSGSYH